MQDVQTAVRRYAFVRPNGAGHSWNRVSCRQHAGAPRAPPVRTHHSSRRFPTQPQPFFCAAGSNATAAPPPVQASDEGGAASASATAVNVQLSTLRPLGIQVLPQESAVWVDAGVLTAHLLQFLADFTTIDAPAGYTLVRHVLLSFGPPLTTPLTDQYHSAVASLLRVMRSRQSPGTSTRP